MLGEDMSIEELKMELRALRVYKEEVEKRRSLENEVQKINDSLKAIEKLGYKIDMLDSLTSLAKTSHLEGSEIEFSLGEWIVYAGLKERNR